MKFYVLFKVGVGTEARMRLKELEKCDNIEKGKIKKEVYKWYQVDTEYQSYLFIMIECPVDSEQPDNIGIHTLRVIYTANQETQFTSWDDISIPGIYTPGTRGDTGTVCVNPRTKGRFCCPYVP